MAQESTKSELKSVIAEPINQKLSENPTTSQTSENKPQEDKKIETETENQPPKKDDEEITENSEKTIGGALTYFKNLPLKFPLVIVQLSSIEPEEREKGLENIEQIIRSTSPDSYFGGAKSLEEEKQNFIILWRGIISNYWLCDKEIPQHKCAEKIASFLLCFRCPGQRRTFFETFWEEYDQFWFSIDKHRESKCISLIRYFLKSCFTWIKRDIDEKNDNSTLEFVFNYFKDKILVILPPFNFLHMKIQIASLIIPCLEAIFGGKDNDFGKKYFTEEKIISIFEPFFLLWASEFTQKQVANSIQNEIIEELLEYAVKKLVPEIEEKAKENPRMTAVVTYYDHIDSLIRPNRFGFNLPIAKMVNKLREIARATINETIQKYEKSTKIEELFGEIMKKIDPEGEKGSSYADCQKQLEDEKKKKRDQENSKKRKILKKKSKKEKKSRETKKKRLHSTAQLESDGKKNEPKKLKSSKVPKEGLKQKQKPKKFKKQEESLEPPKKIAKKGK